MQLIYTVTILRYFSTSYFECTRKVASCFFSVWVGTEKTGGGQLTLHVAYISKKLNTSYIYRIHAGIFLSLPVFTAICYFSFKVVEEEGLKK